MTLTQPIGIYLVGYQGGEYQRRRISSVTTTGNAHGYVALAWPQRVHAFDFSHLRIGVNRCPCLHSGLDEA